MTCAPPKTYQNQKIFWILSKQPPNTCIARWANFFHQKHVFVKHPYLHLWLKTHLPWCFNLVWWQFAVHCWLLWRWRVLLQVDKQAVSGQGGSGGWLSVFHNDIEANLLVHSPGDSMVAFRLQFRPLHLSKAWSKQNSLCRSTAWWVSNACNKMAIL